MENPPWGLVPEKALAEIDKFIKEDLKRSVSDFSYCVFVHLFINLPTWQQPLYGTIAGEGNCARDGEAYLAGLLQALYRVDPAPVGGGPNECDTIAGTLWIRKCFFASFQCDVMIWLSFVVAEKLEARLAVVNQQLALREQHGGPEARRMEDGERTKEQRKKGEAEKVRRGYGRDPVKRISRLFRVPQKPWTKRDVLCLGKTIFYIGWWNWLLTKFISGTLFLMYGPPVFPQEFIRIHHTAAGL
jgi:hypothetical protein